MRKALLLAAGKGTRLGELSEALPKCLMPIQGKPLIEYWLKLLRDGGVEKILVNLHYKADQVKAYLEKSPYRAYVETVYEEELLLTGGTILANQAWFGPQEAFLVAHADNLSLFDVAAFFKAHADRPKGCETTLLAFRSDRPESCGILECDGHGIVQRFHEKVKNPPGNLANGAVYLFEPQLFEYLRAFQKAKIDLSTEVIPKLLGKIFTFQDVAYHRDIGTLESLITAQFDYPKPLTADFMKKFDHAWKTLR